MPVENINESDVMLFSVEQKNKEEDKIEQLSLILEEYKKRYAEFTDIAVHDLHAPVRKLSALIDGLTNKYTDASQNDPQAEELISRIHGCLSDMRSLIDGLSELAAATEDSMKYESCNIREIINEILLDLNAPIKEKKVIIKESPLPIIEGDAIQLKQFFKNILENAICFSKKDTSPEINIQAQRLTDEEKKISGLLQSKQYYKITVADNGIGLKQEYAQKIFQPFVRLHGKSAFAGSGLGLAICKKIADNHRGILFAEGVEDNGTRVILIIPETLN